MKFTPDQERHFYTIWDAEAWRTMPMIDGSLEACLQLHRAGYELVCITSMAAPFVDQRLENFRLHGFPIDRVISTGYDGANLSKNPKKQAIEQLNPVAFVDDSKRNFKDLDNLRTRLIYMDQYDDDPCRHESIHYDAQYANLSVFVHDFLSSEPHGQSIAWCSKSS